MRGGVRAGESAMRRRTLEPSISYARPRHPEQPNHLGFVARLAFELPRLYEIIERG
jgi:hypothetical protein